MSSTTNKKNKHKTRDPNKDCASTSASSSHTQYFQKDMNTREHERITSDIFVGLKTPSITDTYDCHYGEKTRQYTDKQLVIKALHKHIDPVKIDPKLTEDCELSADWSIVKSVAYLIEDPVGREQTERLNSHFKDIIKLSDPGFNIHSLDDMITIFGYLIESIPPKHQFKKHVVPLLKNLSKPIVFNLQSDEKTYFESIRNLIGFMGYLLMILADDEMFKLVADALINQLTLPDTLGSMYARRYVIFFASVPVLYQPIVRMLSITNSFKFSYFLEIAFLLACRSSENCMEMIKENIIENIFCRFNPFFPTSPLPAYYINPLCPQDPDLELGDSSKNIETTSSILFILFQNLKSYLDENPDQRPFVPCPDNYAQRCFVWAYRYECRARAHSQERHALTTIISIMVHVFADCLEVISNELMPDILTLSVLTEIPPRSDWTDIVNFTTSHEDTKFKISLMRCSVDFIKVFPYNRCMVENRYWILGLVYLLDPGLSKLRQKWSNALFSEIRKNALKCLVCALPLLSEDVGTRYGVIRRLMWYIEWYSESPYDLGLLYWCLRALQVAIYPRHTESRKEATNTLFDTHGVIIIMQLCTTLLGQKTPPIERSQALIALGLQLLTSAVVINKRLECCVYSNFRWPASINSLSRKMLDVVLYSLNKHYLICDKWIISLLNLIWEGVIWKSEYRKLFLATDGVYKLLDLVTMTRPCVQNMALALICDIARAGDAVAQLITWRASTCVNSLETPIVKRGANISALIAAVFRDDCRAKGLKLSLQGVIEELSNPLMTTELQKAIEEINFTESNDYRTTVCVAAADLAGSRMSKAFALLHMLSSDLEFHVSLADEAYKLYKNVKLNTEDEAILVLCSHYLTIKLIEAWIETKAEGPHYLPQDNETLEEFIHIGRGWAKHIQCLQKQVFEREELKEMEEENSLYTFLGRARLNIALDALQELRTLVRTADRGHLTHALICDAVIAHHRRSLMGQTLDRTIVTTYQASLDDQNLIGQNIKLVTIQAKNQLKAQKDHLPL